AEIDSKPQLEIYADDVKCSHGSTIGRLDENALFYLRSRGLSEPRARDLLLRAFALEVLERLPARALAEGLDGKPLAFLDSAASAQKPRVVIDAVSELYSAHYANVHRGVYQLSLESTE